MEFLDEDERQAAIRAGRSAVGGAAFALVLAVVGTFLGALIHRLVGCVVAGVAVLVAASFLRTLLHEQAHVLGGLRAVGFVASGLAILIALADLAAYLL
jgi:hypothetical protein